MIPWLSAGQPFPGVDTALLAPNGLLAASSELTVEQLIAAYRQGIFPWYAEGEPVLWWSPDPRMVLYCDEFRVSRSFGKSLCRTATDAATEVTIDRDFEGVMQACAEPRSAEVGTWITQQVRDTYGALHLRGLAHSVETWVDGRLVGGLYGVSIGRMFFGESMFTRATDASKIALATLVRILQAEGVPVIDCQQNTSHLASLGGREIARDMFCAHVASAVTLAPIAWAKYQHARLNALLAPPSPSTAD
jgi:leucyl/phenylalanyl-tRNA---protein transferase